MKCTQEEQSEWFNDTIGSLIAKITLSGDRVEEIVVVDELYDVAAETITKINLPTDFPDQANITRDQLARDFSSYCSQIVLRTATSEQLAVVDDISPELIFIRPITSKMKVTAFVEQWDKSIGFSETLKMMGTPFEYSFEDKKMLFGIAHLMNCMGAQSNRQMAAAPGNVNMFEMK